MSTVPEGLELWMSWKRVGELTRQRILDDVIAHSALTEPEFTVLIYLDESGGTMRQNALATATGWDRTRLSHLLTRMEERGHLARTRLRNGVEVRVLPGGREAFAATRPSLADAVHRYFTGRLSTRQLTELREITAALAADAER